jgi:ADP-heptose:LPS heptosyltransferase
MMRRAPGLPSPRLSLASFVRSWIASRFDQQYAGPGLTPRERQRIATLPEGWSQPKTKNPSSGIRPLLNRITYVIIICRRSSGNSTADVKSVYERTPTVRTCKLIVYAILSFLGLEIGSSKISYIMQIYRNILVVHPGAIGDAIMGTPVPHTLKAGFPGSKIFYLTHPSLFPLLELSGAIDGLLEWNRKSHVFEMARLARDCQPELVIDLVGSLRTRIVSYLCGARTLTYRKEKDSRSWSHVVDNYLSTIKDLELPVRSPVFPTITPPSGLLRELTLNPKLTHGKMLTALVPGVGKHRPNRAWPAQNWVELGQQIAGRYNSVIVLIGGFDDQDVCRAVAQGLGSQVTCENTAGKLTLPETAAMLQMCDVVVSADTGPAHIAAAVGKQVVCLTGPTDPARTGPYRLESLGVNVGASCHCQKAKHCLVAGATTFGDCMRTITVEAVLDKVSSVVPAGHGRSSN